ncbi:hypothetical protein D3C80_916700 [compost metagenome]
MLRAEAAAIGLGRRRAGNADGRSGLSGGRRLTHGQLTERLRVRILDLVDKGGRLVPERGGLVQVFGPEASAGQNLGITPEDQDLVGGREGQDNQGATGHGLAGHHIALGRQHLFQSADQGVRRPEGGFDAQHLGAGEAGLIDFAQRTHDLGHFATGARDDQAVVQRVGRDPGSAQAGIEVLQKTLQGVHLDGVDRIELDHAARGG